MKTLGGEGRGDGRGEGGREAQTNLPSPCQQLAALEAARLFLEGHLPCSGLWTQGTRGLAGSRHQLCPWEPRRRPHGSAPAVDFLLYAREEVSGTAQTSHPAAPCSPQPQHTRSGSDDTEAMSASGRVGRAPGPICSLTGDFPAGNLCSPAHCEPSHSLPGGLDQGLEVSKGDSCCFQLLFCYCDCKSDPYSLLYCVKEY